MTELNRFNNELSLRLLAKENENNTLLEKLPSGPNKLTSFQADYSKFSNIYQTTVERFDQNSEHEVEFQAEFDTVRTQYKEIIDNLKPELNPYINTNRSLSQAYTDLNQILE